MTKDSSQNFLRIRSLDPDVLESILESVETLKNKNLDYCSNQTLILLFEKRSTRTRVSFTRAFRELGGNVIFLGDDDIQLSRGETVPDTGRTLTRYVDAIACRTFEQERIQELGTHFDGPVINGLTDRFHPCQALSDVYTILEHSDNNSDPTVAYVGDGNNVCNSLMEACDQFEISLNVATPPGYKPDDELTRSLQDEKSTIEFFEDPKKAVNESDFIYTDVWVSMGEEDEAGERKKTFQPYQVNKELLAEASSDIKVMHCLPAHRGEEITDEIMDGPNSIVFDQAENRLHVQKALMSYLLNNEPS